jgi:thioredoxin-related protein
MKKWIVPVCAFVVLASSAHAAEKPAIDGAAPGEWTMDIEAARKVAAEKKLPLLLNFTGSDWCGWCKLMDKQVFSQAAWQAYVKPNVMLVWIDFPNDKTLVPEKYVARNKSLSEQYDVEGYPAYVILDDDGITRLGQLGADRDSTPEVFIAKLKAVLESRASAVDALLKSMPAESAQEYRATAKQLDAARSELKALETSYEKKSEELHAAIEKQEKRLATLRVEARLSKLTQEKAEAYRAKQKRLASVQSELEAWIASKPARNEESQKKFSAWQGEITTLEKDLRALLGE